MIYTSFDGTFKKAKNMVHGVELDIYRLVDKASFVYRVSIITMNDHNNRSTEDQFFSNEKQALDEFEILSVFVSDNIAENGMVKE